MLVGVSAAEASCAGPAEASPYAFVGRIVDTDPSSRLATVYTSEGISVQVRGTPSVHGGSVTSVDRTYILGATYEFHPTNETAPFEDNACTATKSLARRDTPGSLLRLEVGQVETSGAGRVTEPTGTTWIGGFLLAGGGGVVLWARRRAQQAAG
jgi:hypothetical protein